MQENNLKGLITNFQDTTRQIINRKIIPLVKYDNPTQSKSTTHIGNNNTSLYYDLKKEREIYNSIIFTNDREKLLYNKRRF